MFDLTNLEDLSLLAETVELECKLARGCCMIGSLPAWLSVPRLQSLVTKGVFHV